MENRHQQARVRRRSVRVAAASIAIAMGLAACSGSGGNKESSASELPKDFSVLVAYGPPTFDQWATGGQPWGTILMVNEPLVRLNGTEFEPVLAESFEAVSPTEYTYTLREGVSFSDGTPLTVEDVKYSLETSMEDTHTASTWIVMKSISDIATEGNTITVTLAAPQPQFQYVVAQTGIVSKAFYETNGDLTGTPDVGQIGTGPYLLDSFTPEEESVIVANPDYWGTKPAFDSVTFTVAADDSARMLALQSGDPTGIFEMPISQVGAVEGLGEYDVQEVPDATVYVVQMDVTKAPFDDPKVREAVRHVIDRQTIVDAVLGGNGVVASTLASTTNLAAVADSALIEKTLAEFDAANEYDVDLAKSLIADSSAAEGFALDLPIESTDPNLSLMGQTVVQDLAAIGIDVTLKPLGDEYAQKVLFEHDHDGLTLNSFSTNTPDPAQPMGYFTPADGPFNLTGLANEEASAKLAESNALPADDPARGQLILDGLASQQEGGAILPLVMPNMYFGLKNGLDASAFTNYWWMDRWDLDVTVS